MKLALIKIELYLPNSDCLKYRRNVVNSIKEQLKRKFNISIIDSSEDGLWKKASLHIVEVNNNSDNLQNDITKILNFIENNDNLYLSNYHVEYL